MKGCVAFSRDSTAEFARFAEQHVLKPVIAKEFAFQDAIEAFQALTDSRWACQDGTGLSENNRGCPYVQAICTRQKALTATLLIALIAWLTTFAISTMRYVGRLFFFFSYL